MPLQSHTANVAPSVLDGIELIWVTSDHAFPRHAHDQFGIGWMVDGAHRSWSGRGAVEAARGDVITVNPNEVHDGLPVRGEVRSWRMMFVSPELVSELSGGTARGRELPRPVASDPILARSVRTTFGALSTDPADVAREAVVLLLADLFERDRRDDLSNAVATSCPMSAPIRRIVERIHDEADDPVSLAELAALSGMSRTSVLRRFRREVGATPSAYAMQLRVRRARALLMGGTPLADAALATGFADQSHLTRAFKRQFGISPGRYRTAIGSGNIVQDAGA